MMRTLAMVIVCCASLPLTGCGSSDGEVLVGESQHGYALAYSPARRVFEGTDGSLHIFFYDGVYVMGVTVIDGEASRPPIQVSHVPVASSGFSVTEVDGSYLVAYSNTSTKIVYTRWAWADSETMTLGWAWEVVNFEVGFQAQAPFIGIDPDGMPWLVFRSDRGAPLGGFPVSMVSAENRQGTYWSDPIEVSSAEQIEDSAAGTSGAIYWPAGETIVVQGGSSALHASVLTADAWQTHVIDDQYTGIHGFSGVVIGNTLYIAYISATQIRLVTYIPGTGWSDPVHMGKGTNHSVSISNVDGEPTVFGYDGQGHLWYRSLQMDKPGILHSPDHDKVLYTWTSSPEIASQVTAVWVESKESPWKVYIKRIELDED